ncbi:MAG TPA: PAS domain-containing protein, partial [Longimicrobiaceae bacterium]|nr:PAS domain-containing protein [Longimicrobiaceae bacterium]
MSSETLAPDPAPDQPGREAKRGDGSAEPQPMAPVLGRALFEQSPLSTVVYDPRGHVLQVNAAFQRLWGAGIDDVPAGYTVLDDPQLRAAGLLPLVERAFAGHAVTTPAVRFEMAEVGGIGQVRWTEAYWYPVHHDDGSLAAVVLTHVDLTDRVEAQEKVRLEEERLRIALEAGQAGSWEWVIGDDRVTWSDELQRMHGLEPGTFGGTLQAAQRLQHPGDAARVAEARDEALRTGTLAVDYRIVLPDGGTRWLEARGGVVRDAGGGPARMLGICTDATERRRREEATSFLARASELLHASLEVEDTLRTVARLSVPLLGDYCIFDVVQASEVRRIAVADPAAPGASRIAEMERFAPRPEGGATPVSVVIASGEWYLEPRWTPAHTRAAVQSPEHAELLDALGLQSVLSVPVAWRGTVYGALTLLFAPGRRHDQADLDLAREVARRAAAAISNARLHGQVRAAGKALEDQAQQLEMQSQQLQHQARELESQQAELEQQLEEMQLLNEELLSTNDELAGANQIAREARAAAEKAEVFSRGILDSISDPFVVHDADWRFRYLNDAASEVFRTVGRGGAERMVGRVLWEEYPDLAGSRVEQQMRRAATERVPVAFEEFYAASGRWSEMRCYPLPDGGLATVWKDITDRRRAEEAAHYLSRGSEILASSLDYEETLGAVARLLVPELGDWCAVQLVDEDGTSTQLAVAHADPARVELARELNRRYPPDTRRNSLVATVLATGQGTVVPEIDDAMLAASAQDDEHLRLVRELGLRSAIVAPLSSGGRVLGTFTLIAAESGRRYSEADL